jgi:phosphoglycerate-specific signal transduction histidine kinase
MTDYSFTECHIAKENIGEHDGDNRFLMESFDKQIEKWQKIILVVLLLEFVMKNLILFTMGIFQWFMRMRMEIVFGRIGV